MPLGPDNPEWVALDDLARRVGAANAVVMDAFNDLWARARSLTLTDQERAFNLLALASSRKPLRAGGHVDTASAEHAPWFVAQSFAATS